MEVMRNTYICLLKASWYEKFVGGKGATLRNDISLDCLLQMVYITTEACTRYYADDETIAPRLLMRYMFFQD